MNAGITFAKATQLRPSIALSAAQVASLTSDIVWLEQQTVTLADGSSTTALVPHVYAALRDGDLAPSGALLGGNRVDLQTSGDVNNSGTIAGRQLVQIDANSIHNTVGSISAQSVSLKAAQDIHNTGGSVIADNTLVLDAGHDINVTSIHAEVRGGHTDKNETLGQYQEAKGSGATVQTRNQNRPAWSARSRLAYPPDSDGLRSGGMPGSQAAAG